LAVVPLLALLGCGSTVVTSTGGAAGLGAPESALAEDGLSLGPTGAADAGQPDGVTAGSGAEAAGPTTADPATGEQSGPGAGAVVAPGPADTTTSASTNSSTTTTATRGPVKVGFFVLDYTAAASKVSGGNFGATQDPQRYWKAVIAGVNATGGLGGRKVSPSFYTLDATQSDWSTQAQAACEQFAQDDKVSLVATQGIVLTSLTACLRKNGIAEISGINFAPSARTLSAIPNMFMPDALSLDREAGAVIDQMARNGFLTSKDRLGVLAADCPGNQDIYRDVVEARAKQYGFSSELFIGFDCPVGFANVSDYAQASQSAALRFRSNGVTKVMYLTPVQNLINSFFAQNAEQQQWYPGYVLSTNSLVMQSSEQIPANQIRNMKGAGWSPILDLMWNVPSSAEQQRCLSLLKAGGLTVTKPTSSAGIIEYNLYMQNCDVALLFRHLLEATRGATGLAQVADAAERVGAQFRAAGTFGPSSFAGRVHDGPTQVAPWSWNTACKCVKYDGQPRPAA
jgi:hypothetical protein